MNRFNSFICQIGFATLLTLFFGLSLKAEISNRAAKNLPATNGPVHSMVEKDGILYFGGQFTHVADKVYPGNAIPLNINDYSVRQNYPHVYGKSVEGHRVAIADGGGIATVAINNDTVGNAYLATNFFENDVLKSKITYVPKDDCENAWQIELNGYVTSATLKDNLLFVAGHFYDDQFIKMVDVTTQTVTEWRHAELPHLDFSDNDKIMSITHSEDKLFVAGYYYRGSSNVSAKVFAINIDSGSLTWESNRFESSGLTYINKLLFDTDRLYVAGHFSRINLEDSSASFPTIRYSLAVLNPTDGSLIEDLNHGLANGSSGIIEIKDLLLDGDVLYVSGRFALRDPATSSTWSKLMAFNKEDLTPLNWKPEFADSIFNINSIALATSNDGSKKLYGGSATSSSTSDASSTSSRAIVHHNSLFEIDPSVSTASPLVKEIMQTDGAIWSISSNGDNLYFGGGFLHAFENGQPRSHIAAIDLTTGELTDFDPTIDADSNDMYNALGVFSDQLITGRFNISWLAGTGRPMIDLLGIYSFTDPTSYRNPLLGDYDQAVYALEIIGDTLYVGGNFNSGSLTNLVAYNLNIHAINTSYKYSPNGTVYALKADDDVLYVGGQFTQIGSSNRTNFAAIASADEANQVFALDVRPSGAVKAIEASESRVIIAGRFGQVNGTPQNFITAFTKNLTTATPEFIDLGINPNAAVTALYLKNNELLIGGTFHRINDIYRNSVGRFEYQETSLPLTIIEWESLTKTANFLPTRGIQDFYWHAGDLYVAGAFADVANSGQTYLLKFSSNAEVCLNQRDDNGDGLTDCDDPQCSDLLQCATRPVCDEVIEICNNGIDDDGDGLIDCEDPNCADYFECNPEICTDGIDNDQDTLIDCADPDCAENPACNQEPDLPPPPAEICTDGIDNDQDGAIDCNDSDCANHEACQQQPVVGQGAQNGNNGNYILKGDQIIGGCQLAASNQAFNFASLILSLLFGFCLIGLRATTKKAK